MHLNKCACEHFLTNQNQEGWPEEWGIKNIIISRIEVMRNCRGSRFSQKQMKGLKYEGSPMVGTVLGKLDRSNEPECIFK